MKEELPWFTNLLTQKRCRAVKEPNESWHYGRCDLREHSEEIDHALERGFDTPRWSTKWTN